MKMLGKNTQNIVLLLLLALIWNLECRKMSGPSVNVLKKVEQCDSTEGHAIKIEKYRINRYNQTVYTYDGNIEFLTELRDEDSETNIMAEKWGNGGWKRNFLRRMPNACTAAKKFAPNYVLSIMKQVNVTDCPIPALLKVLAKTLGELLSLAESVKNEQFGFCHFGKVGGKPTSLGRKHS